jgi:hypothetical protein
MKKRFILLASLFALATLSAQEIQLHYDFGSDREHFTSTIEMFKPDAYGSTFFFVDFNYDVGEVKGISETYFEIARVFSTPETRPFGFQIEYNGGHGRYRSPEAENAYGINDAWLAGIDYSVNAPDYSRGLSFKVLYKNIRDKHDDSYQFTFVWYWHLLDGKVTFRGFADFWREDIDFTFDGNTDTRHVFLTEPQLLYNFTEQFSAGTEIEIGHNFAGNPDKGWQVNPTLFVKYSF